MDIVGRLRDARQWLNNGYCCGQKDSADICAAPACIFGEALKELYEAADEIERLREVVEARERILAAAYSEAAVLREALRKIVSGPRDINKTYAELFAELKTEARAALGEEK